MTESYSAPWHTQKTPLPTGRGRDLPHGAPRDRLSSDSGSGVGAAGGTTSPVRRAHAASLSDHVTWRYLEIGA